MGWGAQTQRGHLRGLLTKPASWDTALQFYNLCFPSRAGRSEVPSSARPGPAGQRPPAFGQRADREGGAGGLGTGSPAPQVPGRGSGWARGARWREGDTGVCARRLPPPWRLRPPARPWRAASGAGWAAASCCQVRLRDAGLRRAPGRGLFLSRPGHLHGDPPRLGPARPDRGALGSPGQR